MSGLFIYAYAISFPDFLKHILSCRDNSSEKQQQMLYKEEDKNTQAVLQHCKTIHRF